MRLKLEVFQLLAVISAIALSNAVPLNRFDTDGNNLQLDRRNGSFDSEFGSVCVIDDVLYQTGDYVPPTSSCERCICEPPTITCSPLPCDFKPNCKAIKMSDECCTVYQCECEHNGRVYQNGERLENPENPCNVCYCRGGEVLCTTIECYRRDDCEPRYVSGRCCPKYDHCPPIDQLRIEKTRPQFIRTDFNHETTVSVDPPVQQRNGLFDLDNEASEDVTATAMTTTTTEAQEQHSGSEEETTTEGIHEEISTVKLHTTESSLPSHNDVNVSKKHRDSAAAATTEGIDTTVKLHTTESSPASSNDANISKKHSDSEVVATTQQGNEPATITLQTTESSPVSHNDASISKKGNDEESATESSHISFNDASISVKHNIRDHVQLTADISESIPSESRKILTEPKLIPVTHKPIEDNPASTSFYSSEEGSGTTSFILNDGILSSTTEGIEFGSGSQLESDISSGDEEGSGTEEPEIQTERVSLKTNSPEVRIISDTTSESVESNEVVTDPTTIIYSRHVTKKQQQESTKFVEFSTVTEISKTSPIEDLKTESFLIHESSDKGTTSESQEFETTTKKENMHQTKSSEEEDIKTTGQVVTESNELADEGKATTTSYNIKLKSSSDEHNHKSEGTSPKRKAESFAKSTESRDAVINDQDISETNANTNIHIADATTQQSLTTILDGDEITTPIVLKELGRVPLTSDISAVRIFNDEKKSSGPDNTQEETATESFVNLDNEFPVLPIGSVLINNQMELVLATTEDPETDSDENGASSYSAEASTERTSFTETETAHTTIKQITETPKSSDHQEGINAAGSHLLQRIVSERESTTQLTLGSTKEQSQVDATTTVPSSLLKGESVEATVLVSTDNIDTAVPTTTEIILNDEAKSSSIQQITRQLANSNHNHAQQGDSTTLPSEHEEITAVTQKPRNAEGSTGSSFSEDLTTLLPETTEHISPSENSPSHLAAIQTKQAPDSLITKEPSAASTDAPKVARTDLSEASTLHEAHETTTQFSDTETTTDLPETFIHLASDASSVNERLVNLASSESTTLEAEEATEQNKKALLRAAVSDVSQSNLGHKAEVTTTSAIDQESSNTDNSHVRTEIYQQDATELPSIKELVTEKTQLEQRSGLKVESASSEVLLNDSPNTGKISTLPASEEITTQPNNVEETTQFSENISLLAAGSANLTEKIAIKLLAEPGTVSEPLTTEEPEEAEQQDETGVTELTLGDEPTSKLSNDEEPSSFPVVTTSLPIVTSTSLPEQSKNENVSKSKSVLPLEEATTQQPTYTQEETTEYPDEEATPENDDITPTPSCIFTIKREVATSTHTTDVAAESTDAPVTSRAIPDVLLLKLEASEVSSTDGLPSSEVVSTETPHFSLNSSDNNEKLKSGFAKQEESSTLIPEELTTEESIESTQEPAESSTKLYIEDITNIPHKSAEKKEEIARLVNNVVDLGNSHQNDTEIEVTTLPRDWLKSDNVSDTTENPGFTVDEKSEEEEYVTYVTEISTVTEIQKSAVEDEIAPETLQEDVRSVNISEEKNSTLTGEEDQNDSDDVTEHKHTVKTRAVNFLDINSGNDNSFFRPESLASGDLDKFYTLLFHRHNVDHEEGSNVI